MSDRDTSNSKNSGKSSGCLTVFGVLFIIGLIGNLIGGDDGSTGDNSSSTDCSVTSGVYAGYYGGMTTVGARSGSVGVVLSEGCRYQIHMDGSETTSGVLDEVGGAEYQLESGGSVYIEDGSMWWTDSGQNYRIRYELERVE